MTAIILIASSCALACFRDESPYRKYIELKRKQAQLACKTILMQQYPAVSFLIKELTNQRPFLGYYGHGLNEFLSTSLDQSSAMFKSLSRDYIYPLSNGNTLTIYKWFILTESTDKDLINEICLLKKTNHILFLKAAEELNVARVAHYCLSKILDADIEWTDNLELLQEEWASLWDGVRMNNLNAHAEGEKKQLKSIEDAIQRLGFDGPYYDQCSNIYCRWLLENKGSSIRKIFKIALRNEEFYGMYSIKTYIKQFDNRYDAEKLLQLWQISKSCYSNYMYELRTGRFIVIYTKMQLFPNIPNSSMVTSCQDVSVQLPRNIHVANILLRIITGQSVEWETGSGAERRMIKKWKELLKIGGEVSRSPI